ncbi:hypothetical protein Clacol_002733 [Clathrus columnatus]|uniref:BTB domain-containing protein n=1 Tax=Clathrus columnatus TaxID=1419009 RepID=A0AAV5A9D5_9AGAM|nr:hypothetical protein Clacol_002733 [Clathrus columnatus]
MTQDNNWQRHRDLYFSDGSIVLLADKTVFRVYIGLLTLHSSVFKELIESAQHPIVPTDSETYDGCPLLRLQDTPEDLTHLLKTLLSWFGPGGKPISYSTASAVLRLSNKYMMQQFQELATRHFGRIIPKSYKDVGKEESYEQVFGSDHPHPFRLLALFRECGLQSFLPWTYYVACSLGFEKLIQGDCCSGREPVYLDPQDVSIALLGWKSLCEKTQEIRMSAISSTAFCVSCANHWIKGAAVKFQSQALERWGVFKTLAQTSGQLFPSGLSGYDYHLSLTHPHPQPCKLCRTRWLEHEEYARSVVWSQLPEIFGLPASVMWGLQAERREMDVPMSESGGDLLKYKSWEMPPNPNVILPPFSNFYELFSAGSRGGPLAVDLFPGKVRRL